MAGLLFLPAREAEQAAALRRRVIVEELLHLKAPNRGQLFKALLRSYLEEEP